MDYHGGPLSDSFFTGWACTYETRDDMGGVVSEMVSPECQGVDVTYVVDVSDDDAMVSDNDAQIDGGDDDMLSYEDLIQADALLTNLTHHVDTMLTHHHVDTMILPDDESSDDSVDSDFPVHDSDLEPLIECLASIVASHRSDPMPHC